MSADTLLITLPNARACVDSLRVEKTRRVRAALGGLLENLTSGV